MSFYKPIRLCSHASKHGKTPLENRPFPQTQRRDRLVVKVAQGSGQVETPTIDAMAGADQLHRAARQPWGSWSDQMDPRTQGVHVPVTFR